MKIRVSFKPKIILILSLAAIGMSAISAYFFTRLHYVVHVDLYNYGLQFSREWAAQYWTYSKLAISFLAVAMLATGISIVFVLIHLRSRSTSSRFASNLLLALGIALTSFSTFFFTRLDYVIHNDLYNYGLQFSYEWTVQYWTYANTIFSLLGLTIATNTITILLTFLSSWAIVEIDTTKLICYTLIPAGAIALALSILYASSILAFIGLGLVFWGIIIKYVTTEEYVKKTLLDTTMLSSLIILDEMLRELDYNGKAVYLPPKYLRELESNKVYIPKHENAKVPTPQQILQEDKIFIKNPEGILLKPPGNELTKLFEKTLQTSFTKVNLPYLEQNLPKLLIEELEIAKDIKIEIEKSIVRVRIENSIYKDICKETMKLSDVSRSLGCPISSAIACTLAKATGKPVIINEYQTSEDGKTIYMEYELFEEPEQKLQ